MLGMLVATLLSSSAATASDGEFWTCGGAIKGDGFEGGYWQWFQSDGQASQLILQIYSGPERRLIQWHLINRFSTEKVMKDQMQFGGRSIDAAFRDGPSNISLEVLVENPAPGPLFAYYFGDGIYRGIQKIVSAKDNRKYYKGKKTYAGASLYRHPRVEYDNSHTIKQLADAKTWQVIVTDSKGNRVGQSDSIMPSFQMIERVFMESYVGYEAKAANFRDSCDYDDGTPQIVSVTRKS